MPRFFGRLLLWLLLATFARGASPLEHARRAAAMLGPEVWLRVIRVENSARHSEYPRTVYALVFELNGILWFYTDANGTQSFSLHANNLAAERADFAPLLNAIEPGFSKFSFLPDAPANWESLSDGTVPYGCFIEGVAALRERVNRGELVGRARLLSYYWETPRGRVGHTVLTYETPAGAFVVDPQVSGSPRRLSRRLPDDPRVVARTVRPELQLSQARWVPTPIPQSRTLVAALAGGPRAKIAAEREPSLQ